ncbi:MAG: polyprenyl synthetase family protein [Chloroflexi bacterium]|nr:MAG: polyprenyl synthetase family protein [Chloroflexota bacterium]MBL1196025.1 polyprenyl synthetase family protein [Chloroflexota bacterium]NOH13319.1 polyprenyl synthetase family protein [Chloroflexota bacterium]
MESVTLTTVDFFAPVQDHVAEVERRMRAQANGQNPDLDAAIDLIISSGGKRVRPTVSLLVGGMIGASPERVLTLAAAVELLHTATLVHDDLIDGSLLRRGMPTLNAQWSPAATILTGDFIFARAAKLAADTDSIDVMQLFAKTLSTVVGGEISQMFESKGSASRDDYYNRIYAKTASMFELAAVAPGYLSDVFSDADLDALNRYGYEVGMAFQMVDDVFDFTSEADDIGKPVANDLRQGLITLPALYYFEDHAEDLDMVTSSNGHAVGREDMDRLITAIRDSGAIQQALEEAQQYAERAVRALDRFPNGSEKQALIDLANYVVERLI